MYATFNLVAMRCLQKTFIGGINIKMHAIFMEIRIVHTLRADWL